MDESSAPPLPDPSDASTAGLPPAPPSDDAEGAPSAARPAFLLGGLSSLSNIQRVRRPSRDELVEFTARSPASKPQSWTVSATERIREFDSYRLHNPSPQEKERVTIPASIDRINVTHLNHLLILCGGYRSVRFSTAELTELTRLAHALEDSFCIVEKHYKDMSGAQKKLKLIPIVSTNEISVQNETAVTAFSNSDEVVIQFHILADRYADSIMELQALVRLKQSQIVPRTECTNEEKGAGHIGETHDVTPGADIDLLAGLARPLWLDVLMLKYSRHMIARSGTPPSAVVEAMGQNYPFCNPLNLGSFCSFLSCCLVGKISIVVLEHQALIELMLASNDSVLRINPITDSVQEITNKILEQSQEYWAKRIFAFLKKLPDLKTANKDNKQLLNFDIHI